MRLDNCMSLNNTRSIRLNIKVENQKEFKSVLDSNILFVSVQKSDLLPSSSGTRSEIENKVHEELFLK
jgi:hypothetical protein